jgi:BMFP domain-containing protein YqiC
MEREAREKVSRVEAKSTTMLASARKEIESLVRKITLLEGEHAEVRWAHEVAEETTCG